MEREREEIMSSDPPMIEALILLASLAFAELAPRQKVCGPDALSEFSLGF